MTRARDAAGSGAGQGGAEMTTEPEDSHKKAGMSGGGLSPTGKTRLPEPTDAGLDAVWRAPQGLGTSGIRLSKRDGEIESRELLTTVFSERSSGKSRVTPFSNGDI